MKSVARLYAQFQPETYDLTLDIDEQAMHFKGSLVIVGKKVGRPSQRITLHQNKLKITSASITKHDKRGSQEIAVKRINNQDTLHEVRLHTEGILYSGTYQLTLKFEAPLTTGMTGIYPCFFKDGADDKQLIMTQFESHHAREAFPCIDEPEAKATFDLTLITRTGITVLSNTPVKATQTEGKRLTTTFEATPKMSTYLLAFVFGELISKSTRTQRDTQVSVWSTAAQPHESLDFALDAAKRTVEYFEEYFGMTYPLPKLDHVACPDLSAGAMENWGLITYRERLLLAYPEETAQSTLEQIALVIAHETSHMWFGDLVTMRWWDDLWLNESFANMMEYQAIDHIFPDWHIWDSFVAGEGLSALRRDAVAGVQAVKTAVHHPDEISSLFDPSIVYAKGGRLLYMLKNYIGEDTFRAGLKQYFEAHAYHSTEGADLWAALSEASDKDIAAFMSPWLTRSGFPLVSVTQDDHQAVLRQEHFTDNPSKSDSERFWLVPLFANVIGQPGAFSKPEQRLSLKTSDVLLLNTEARGHYLVRYMGDAQNQAILSMVRNKKLGEADRLMLLNGGSMMSKAGYESFGKTLTMLGAYGKETSEPVWDIMALILGEARRFVDLDKALEDQLKSFTDTLVAAQTIRLGWEPAQDESAADTKLRALVLGLSAYAENRSTLKRAAELFLTYQEKPAKVSAELRVLAFIVPVKAEDSAAFNYLLHLHDATQNSDLKADICDALTATHNPQKASLLLARLTNAQLIKPQDVDRWLVYLLRNRHTREVAWDWLVANWQWLEDTFKHDKSYDYLPRYAASCVNTREYQQRFRDLFENKQDQPLLRRNIQLGFEEIETRISWLERDLQSVQQFFKNS